MARLANSLCSHRMKKSEAADLIDKGDHDLEDGSGSADGEPEPEGGSDAGEPSPPEDSGENEPPKARLLTRTQASLSQGPGSVDASPAAPARSEDH